MIHYALLSSPIVAFLMGLAAIRVILRFAPSLEFVDNPDRRRKLHESPIALGGGIAVWIATWGAWGAGAIAFSSGDGGASNEIRALVPLATASFLVLVLGVIDDRFGMRGCHKLAGQLVAAALVVASVLRIDALSGLGVVIELGVFACPITALWIVLVVNAFNLIDGMDGFCGGVGLVIAVALACMGFRSGRVEDASIALALVGALAAFLGSNLPPARIYLGDAGSMTLGMMFSVLSVRACSGGPATPVSLMPLIALLALPLLDVATALCRRWLTGHSLFMPDRGHIHHRLRIRLGRTSVALGAGLGLTAFAACGATVARTWGLPDVVAVLAIVTPVVVLVGTNTFGASELRLLAFRLRRYGSRFLEGATGEAGTVRQECRLHGGRDWARVWDALIRSVEAGEVRRIELAIDMPAAGETYHALWSLPTASAALPSWSVVHSVHVGGVRAGEMRVAGSIDASRDRYLEKVEELVRILEGHLEADAPPPAQAPPGVPAHGIGRVALRGPDIRQGI